MLVTGKNQYACRKRTSHCFALIASRTVSAVLESGGCWGFRIVMHFESDELSLVELYKGTTQSTELSLVPCSAILLQNLIVTSFGANMSILRASQMDNTESKDFPNVENTYAVRASKVRVGKSKVPSCAVDMAVSSGKTTAGLFMVHFSLNNGASILR